MRYVALFFGLTFLLFAYWQFNDPDPVWWITIYLVAAYASYRVFLGHYNRELLLVLAVLYAAAAFNAALQITAWEGYFSEGAGLTMKSLNQELARESTGMAICALVMAMYAAVSHFAGRRSTHVQP